MEIGLVLRHTYDPIVIKSLVYVLVSLTSKIFMNNLDMSGMY